MKTPPLRLNDRSLIVEKTGPVNSGPHASVGDQRHTTSAYSKVIQLGIQVTRRVSRQLLQTGGKKSEMLLKLGRVSDTGKMRIHSVYKPQKTKKPLQRMA